MVNERTGGQYLSKERIQDSASVFIKKKQQIFCFGTFGFEK
jgi:hypothetical protein